MVGGSTRYFIDSCSAISMLLLLLIAGCSDIVEQDQSGTVIDSELKLDEVETSQPTQTIAPEKTVVVPKVVSDPWAVVRDHVTSNYAISQEYFDSHFVFDSIEANVRLRSDEFDPMTRSFPVLTDDAELVKYHLVLKDDFGSQQIITDYLEGVYLYEGKVVDSATKDLAIDADQVPRRQYNSIAPTHEMAVKVNRQEAIQQGKYIVDCNRKEFFDTWEARENMALEFRDGRLVWTWESKGNACFINAERPGEVEVLII